MALFGDFEMQQYAASNPDTRVLAMWNRIQASKSNAAKWCEEVNRLRAVNTELIAAFKEASELLDELYCHGERPEGFDKRYAKWLAKEDLIIAKAEGASDG